LMVDTVWPATTPAETPRQRQGPDDTRDDSPGVLDGTTFLMSCFRWVLTRRHDMTMT
jgi:hypothetical protein